MNTISDLHTLTDDDGRIVRDMHCLNCDYNLRMLDLNSRCPECGASVGRSAIGDRLRYCDPDWLRNVWYGLNCLAGVIIGGVVVAGMMATGLVGNMIDTGKGVITLIIPAAVFCTGSVVSVIGWWKSTMAEPGRLGRSSRFSARSLARTLWIGVVVLYFVFAATAPHFPFASWWLGYWIGFITVAALVCNFVLILCYARSLAKRIPAPSLRRFTALLIVFLGGVGMLFHVVTFNWFGVVEWLERTIRWNRGSTRWWSIHQKLFEWTGIALAVIAIAVSILGFACWITMKKQADMARQSWAREPFFRVQREREETSE